jgi:hypothetical protein
MNVRKNLLLVIGGGSFAVLLLVALVFLFRANADFQGQRKVLERQYKRLTELNTRKPFPSVENIEKAKRNLDQLEYRVVELGGGLSRDPLPADAIDAADFSAQAQDVIERFRKRAVDAGILLPENLEVGFARYASGGAIPEQAHVPRLSRQLYSVEKVVDVLVRSGAHSIEALTRDIFEIQTVPVPEETDSRRRRPRREVTPAKPGKNIHTVASAVQPDGLYAIERIGASFTATEDEVWRTLDLLASAPHFMVVVAFRHNTQSDILAYNPEAVKRGGEGDDEALRFLAGGILSGSKALSRPERIIAGNELVRVTISVDVYNFAPVVEDPLQ